MLRDNSLNESSKNRVREKRLESTKSSCEHIPSKLEQKVQHVGAVGEIYSTEVLRF